MTNSEPLVSIIIPVYNGSNYLKEAIDSAINQTYSNFEVIVVNDGSSDNGETEKIALSYGNKIRYFSKTNGGVATALNLAIKEMEGDYFSWLSHDDMYYPNKLEEQIKALKECGDMKRIVITDYDVLNENNKALEHVKLSNNYSIDSIEKSVFSILQNIVNGCSMLIHKSHFDRVGKFNEGLITTQDYELWFRMFRGQKILYVPQSLTISRLHGAQGSNTIKSYAKEREELHDSFVKKISDEEIIDMYGSKNNFYSKMLAFFRGNGMKEAFNEINKLFQETDIPDDLSIQVNSLKEYLNGVSNNKAEKICIFGAGDWGIRLYTDLTLRLINVDLFCDNSPKKYGYLMDNKQCISFDELKTIKDNTLIIIAVKSATDAIKQQLIDNGFRYFITKQEIDKKFFDVPAFKWLTSLEGLDGLDYSSKGIQSIVSKFKDTIFDVCSYYENRNMK